MNEIMMHQCNLKSEEATLITWLSNEKKFKVGDFVTLKDSDEPKRIWKVLSKGKAHPRSDIKRSNLGAINDLHRR